MNKSKVTKQTIFGKVFKKIKFFNTLSEYWKNRNIRNRFLFTIGAIILYRILANIPPVGINIGEYTNFFKDNPLTSVFTLATGGNLDNPSLVMVGLGAYINASIIIQLLSTVIPKLEELSKEGQRGRLILSQYTRFLTIPLSILQSIVIYIMLSRGQQSGSLVSSEINLNVISFIASLTAGSLFLMWLGELISEHGIGNGSSILISFAILSTLPSLLLNDLGQVLPVFEAFKSGSISFVQMLTAPTTLYLYGFIIGFILLIVLIVFVNEGIRKITIQYARRTVGRQDNYLPIRVTQAGVMPIIFASAMLTFPGIVAQLLSNTFAVDSVGDKIVKFIINSPFSDYGSVQYILLYFFLIIGFTFFYTFIVSKPSETADNLKKSGAFIPGIRPGKTTEKYIIDVMIRLTVVGSLFLAFLAVIPSIARALIGESGGGMGLLSGIGGTSILIMVSVLLSTYRQLSSMKVTKSYDQYR